MGIAHFKSGARLAVGLIVFVYSARAGWVGDMYGDARTGAPTVIEQQPQSGGSHYSAERVMLRVPDEDGREVPVRLCLPTNPPPYASVLLLHGHKLNKEWATFRFAESLAAQGIASVAYDLPDHGERARDDFATFWDYRYELETMASGIRPSVVDGRRVLDYLSSRPEFDTEHIAVMGYSLGSYVGGILMGVDPRPLALVQNVGGANKEVEDLARVVPELWSAYAPFFPSYFPPEVAPRPIFMLNGVYDLVVSTNDAQYMYDSWLPPKEIAWYASGHDLPDQATDDAVAWLWPRIRRVTVSQVSTPLPDGAYGVGVTVPIQLQFSENVTVDTAGGVPSIPVDVGDLTRHAPYVSGSGGSLLTFNYTIAAGDISADLALTGEPIALNGGRIVAAYENPVVRILPAPGSPGSLSGDHDIALATPCVLRFALATVDAIESDGAVQIEAVRLGATTAAVQVAFATTGGTAAPGVDYQPTAGTLSFAAGDTSETFPVTLLPNALPDDTRTVGLELTAPTAGAVLGTHDTALLRIIDDDAARELIIDGAPELSGQPTPYGYGTQTVQSASWVALAVNTPASVAPGLRDRTLGWTGSGDIPNSGTNHTLALRITQDSALTWQWQRQVQLTLPAPAHGTLSSVEGWYDAGEAIAVRATPESGFAFDRWLGDVPFGRERHNPVTLTMDQPRALTAQFVPLVSLRAEPTIFNEAAGSVVYAQLAAPAPTAVHLDLSFGGTATPGVDYTPSAAQIDIAAGQESGSITLLGIGDALSEGAESITVTIDAATGAAAVDPLQLRLLLTDFETPWPGGYTYRIPVRAGPLDDTTGGILTNFPLRVSCADAGLRSLANGGHVKNAAGDDLLVVAEDGTTLRAFEIEHYDETTGDVELWVSLPTFTPADEQLLYLCYGNPAATGNENIAGVWNTDYAGVWHLDEATANGSAANGVFGDSSGTGNAGDRLYTSRGAGRIAGAQAFSPAYLLQPTQQVRIPDSIAYDLGTSPFCLSFWFRKYGFSYDYLLDWTDAAGDGVQINCGSSNLMLAPIQAGSATTTVTSISSTYTPGIWHLVSLARDPYGAVALTIDGVQRASRTFAADLDVIAANTDILLGQNRKFEGQIDEFRFQTAHRPANWLRARYLTESAPDAYVPSGGEEANAAVITATLVGVVVDEDVGQVVIPFRRTGRTDQAVSVGFTTVAGSAVPTDDYVAQSGALLFGIGETSNAVTVAIVDNGFPQEHRTFRVELTTPGADTAIGTPLGTDILIHDNDRDWSLGITGAPSDLGTGVPLDYGAHDVQSASQVVLSVSATVPIGPRERWGCVGWSGTGSVPATGATNSVSFQMLEASTLVWQWQQEFEQTASAFGGGAVTPATAWGGAASPATFEALPNPDQCFAGWTGDVPPSQALDNPLTLPADQPRDVVAQFVARAALPGFSCRKTIRIPRAQVSGKLALTNFPICVSVTDPDLRTVAEGGQVLYSDGRDIVVTADDGLALLSHELTAYDPVLGTLRTWVKVPRLSPRADTTLQLYAGSGSYTNPPAGAPAVWANQYVGVWHMQPPASGKTLVDSSPYANHITKKATEEPQNRYAGWIGGAQRFDGDDDYAYAPKVSSLAIAGDITLSYWIHPETLPDYGEKHVLCHAHMGEDAPANTLYSMGQNNDNGTVYPSIAHEHAHGQDILRNAEGPVDRYVWRHIAVIRNVAQRYYQFVIDGRPQALQSFEEDPEGGSDGQLYLGGSYGGYSRRFEGLVDEIRIAPVARDTNWVITAYRNQADPAGFSEWSSECHFALQAGSGGVVAPSGGWYRIGSELSAEALPDPGFAFDGWSGDVPPGLEASNPLSFPITATGSATAGFVPLYTTNGVPVAWLWHYYGESSNYNALALSDTDDDRHTASQEYWAGTVPTNAASVLSMRSIDRMDPASAVVTWLSVSGRLYRLERTTNLLTSFGAVDSHIPATPPLNTYTDSPVALPGFYRVTVE